VDRDHPLYVRALQLSDQLVKFGTDLMGYDLSGPDLDVALPLIRGAIQRGAQTVDQGADCLWHRWVSASLDLKANGPDCDPNHKPADLGPDYIS
jgi:hypothetical protein